MQSSLKFALFNVSRRMLGVFFKCVTFNMPLFGRFINLTRVNGRLIEISQHFGGARLSERAKLLVNMRTSHCDPINLQKIYSLINVDTCLRHYLTKLIESLHVLQVRDKIGRHY
jgi:hypothetical protein